LHVLSDNNVSDYQLPTTKLSITTNYQVINYQLSTTDYQLP